MTVVSVPPPPAPGPRSVTLRSFIPYLRGQYRLLAGAAGLSLVATGGYLTQPLLFQEMLERLGVGDPVAGPVVLLIALLCGVTGLYSLTSYLLQRVGEGIVLRVRRELAGHLLRLPIIEYDQGRTGDLLARVGADTTLLRGAALAAQSVATPIVIITGAGVTMLLIDPVMFVVTALALVGLVFAMMIARRIQAVSQQAQARVGDLTAALDRAVTGVRTVRAARAEDRETATIDGHATAAYRAGVRMAGIQALVTPTSTVMLQGGFLAVLGIGGARVATGAMPLADMVAFVVLMFLLMFPVNLAMISYTQLQAGLGALQRIEDVLAVPTEAAADPPAADLLAADPPAALTRLGPPAATAPPAVAFDRVTFGYGEDEPVLHEVSFTVPIGSRTALVGPSGAGKSTVLALVERFYDARSGEIRVAGVDVSDQPRDVLRAQLGYVEQDAPVLAGTLRDNLLLTDPTATDAELRRVLAAVNLADLVARASEGLSAQVGEAGVLLSGGERQRLAIARALLAAPPILLLDEPTSNLDSRNEQALQQAISTASSQRTLLIVAHRLATVIDADQIVVLDRGRVVATGTHDALSGSSPLYQELTAHQLLVT